MPIRIPFAKRGNDENLRPELLVGKDVSHPGFERVDTVGSKASSALSIRSVRSQDNGDYKMSGMKSQTYRRTGDTGSPGNIRTSIFRAY
jgi:hypothetical protein